MTGLTKLKDSIPVIVDIEFSVPVGGGYSDRITLPAYISWTDFRYRIAEKMGIAASKLSIAYRFTSTPVKQSSSILSEEAHFRHLVESATASLRAAQTSKSQKAKQFHVIIVDRNEATGKAAKPAAAAKTMPAVKSKRISNKVSLCASPVLANLTRYKVSIPAPGDAGSDDEREKHGEAADNEEPKTAAQYTILLQNLHKCTSCTTNGQNTFCLIELVKVDGKDDESKHCNIDPRNISLWSHLLVTSKQVFTLETKLSVRIL